jgi:hypothetical protein
MLTSLKSRRGQHEPRVCRSAVRGVLRLLCVAGLSARAAFCPSPPS